MATGFEVGLIASMIASTGAQAIGQARQTRQARRSQREQADAMGRAERRAASQERQQAMAQRRANRRRPNTIAGMAATRGMGGTMMTGPMGLGGSTTLGGGGGMV